MRRLLTAATILCLLSFGFVWAQDPEGELDYFYIVCGVNGYPGSGTVEICFKLRFHTDNTGDNKIEGFSAPVIITGNNIVSVDTTLAKAFTGTAVEDWNILAVFKPDDPDPTVPPFHMAYSALALQPGITGDSVFCNICVSINDTGTICIDTMSTEFANPYFYPGGAGNPYTPGWAGPFCCQVVLCQERAGDANNDGMLSVADVIYNVNHVFKGGPAPSLFCQGDLNADNRIDLTDLVYEVTYLFKGGLPPKKSGLCCL